MADPINVLAAAGLDEELFASSVRLFSAQEDHEKLIRNRLSLAEYLHNVIDKLEADAYTAQAQLNPDAEEIGEDPDHPA